MLMRGNMHNFLLNRTWHFVKHSLVILFSFRFYKMVGRKRKRRDLSETRFGWVDVCLHVTSYEKNVIFNGLLLVDQHITVPSKPMTEKNGGDKNIFLANKFNVFRNHLTSYARSVQCVLICFPALNLML